jgi:uncharacterized protein (DUF1697 family)
VALVVLLRGVNVGGSRTFRPSMLAEQLNHLDVVNLGAAGTFVIRRPVSRAEVKGEFARRLPFDAQIVICRGSEILELMSRDFFSNQVVRPDIVRFVSVFSRSPSRRPATPMTLPSSGQWLVKILAGEGRFVVGLYRRRMAAIGQLGKLDQLFGLPATTRNWNTITTIAKVLDPLPGQPG